MGLGAYCPSTNPDGAVVALGELLVDLIPETPHLRLYDTGPVIKAASGSAGIFACAAARFGAHSIFMGKVGKDALSRMVNAAVAAEGVDLRHVVESAQGQIGLAFLEYVGSARNYQYYRSDSVGSRFTPEDVDIACLRGAYALHFPGMLLDINESLRAACLLAAQTARTHGVLFSFDPNIRGTLDDPARRRRMLDIIAMADIIEPTLDEARMITQKTSIGDILRTLHALGPRVVALTRDKDGAVISAGGQVAFADGIDVGVLDPTGAGDTFAAALVACMQQDLPIEETARFCNAAGTLVTTQRGAIGRALPTAADVRTLAASPQCVSHVAPLADID